MRSLPKDVAIAEYDIAITAQGAPQPEVGMYIRHGTSHRSIQRIAFSQANRGNVGWITAYYTNPRDQAGLISTAFQFDIIQDR